MADSQLVPEPATLAVEGDGTLSGRTGSYDKFLGDLEGVYLDDAAYKAAVVSLGADRLVYRVEEHRNVDGPGALIIGTSTLLPGRVGEEFAVTRGHLHSIPDRAELYHCLSGAGVMVLETVDGRSRTVAMTPGDVVHVPGHWIHRSVNVGPQPFVTLFCYSADAGQNYRIIEEAGGMANLVVSDGKGGWVARPNPRHVGYDRAA
jgi:glucose-6-phosphate isomerase